MEDFLIVITRVDFVPKDMKGLMKELDDILSLYLTHPHDVLDFKREEIEWQAERNNPELYYILNQIPIEYIVSKIGELKYMYMFKYILYIKSQTLLISVRFE
jgi:hypothetical protein